MEKAVRELIEQVPYNVKLIVKAAGANELLLSKEIDDVFSSASLIKVPILLAVLAHLERENESLEQSVKILPENHVEFSVITEQKTEECSLYELLVWMIIMSDNTATNVLIDFLGIDKLNDYFKVIGLTQTKLQRKMMDFVQLEKGYDNVTTASDMGKLFTAIYRKELLSSQYSELAMGLLSRQRVHESLKRYLIDDVRIAHKTGSLDTVEHDIGIVFASEFEYIIGVFVTNHTNKEEAKKLIGKISKMVYQHLGKGQKSI